MALADRKLWRRETGYGLLGVIYGAFLYLFVNLVNSEQWDAAVSLFSSALIPTLGLVAGLWALKVYDPMSKRSAE